MGCKLSQEETVNQKRNFMGYAAKIESYTYEDMLCAFQTGRKHMVECGDSLDDCWDFAGWIKNYVGGKMRTRGLNLKL